MPNPTHRAGPLLDATTRKQLSTLAAVVLVTPFAVATVFLLLAAWGV